MTQEIDWFTDIDGVINVFPSNNDAQNRGPHLRQWKQWKQVVIDNYPITYSPNMIERMNRVGESVNIHMLTTWYETSVSFFNPGVGLESTSYIPRKIGLSHPLTANQSNPNKEAEWWKLNAVKEHIEAHGNPFIWTDDQINGSIRRYINAVAKDMGIPCLIITPFQTMGIEKRQMDAIEKFVAENI